MIKNSKFKPMAVILVICALLSVLSTTVFAQVDSGERLAPVYFDYKDGVCRDGAVGDRPGIIGDEDKYDHRDAVVTSSLVGGNNNNINDNVLPENRPSPRNAATSDIDEDNASNVFWGVLIALLIATAIILLIVLMTPKTKRKQ